MLKLAEITFKLIVIFLIQQIHTLFMEEMSQRYEQSRIILEYLSDGRGAPHQALMNMMITRETFLPDLHQQLCYSPLQGHAASVTPKGLVPLRFR